MADVMPAPTPIERKRKLGNPGKRTLPRGLTVIEPASATIEAPRDGDALVVALMEGPAAAWIANPDRLGILELLRDAWDERIALRAHIREHGYGSGAYGSPQTIRLERVERNLTTWLSLLGLTPTDRSRLGVAEVKARSKLEELRDRRDRRSRAG